MKSYTASSAVPTTVTSKGSAKATATSAKEEPIVTKNISTPLSMHIGAAVSIVLAATIAITGALFVWCVRKRETNGLATISMLVFLLFGTEFALGHHLFYQSLEGTRASVGGHSLLGFNISRQEANTAIGTAFAFLVKACLVCTVTIAFTQLFWQAAKSKRSSEPPTLHNLDVLSTALSDLSTLFRIHVWWRSPLLFLVAAAAWYVELVSNHQCMR